VSQTACAPTATTTQTDLVALLTDLFTDTFGAPAASVQPDASLESLDFDSLVQVELAVILERVLGVTIDESDLRADQTVREAADMLLAKTQTA
jgi:acyl carrier protein